MSAIRTDKVYLSTESLRRLRFLADVNGFECVEDQLAVMIQYYMLREYPDLESVFEQANRARKKILEEARQRLRVRAEVVDQARRESAT